MLISLEEQKGGYIQIKKAYILFGGIVAVSFLGGWFAFYFIQAPQMDHVVNGTGYQHGYINGFTDSVKEIYDFNSQSENLITTDSKNGFALTNGTTVSFFWFDSSTNQTRGLNLKAHEDLGQTRVQGTLNLMTSPVKWPQQIVQAFNITQKQYMVLQTSTGHSYLLDQAQ
jgi:hypothetical protein